MRLPIAVLAGLLVGACGSFPKDQDGTLDTIRESGELRVGLTAMGEGDAGPAKAFIADLAKATGARAVVTSGSQESQLAALEAGDLDLVIGEFADDSPWIADVALIEPLRRRALGEHKAGLAPVVANGENAFVILVEKTVRDSYARAGA